MSTLVNNVSLDKELWNYSDLEATSRRGNAPGADIHQEGEFLMGGKNKGIIATSNQLDILLEKHGMVCSLLNARAQDEPRLFRVRVLRVSKYVVQIWSPSVWQFKLEGVKTIGERYLGSGPR
jgi:hypothetical protein